MSRDPITSGVIRLRPRLPSRGSRGFTLVEMITVAVIVSILAAVAVPLAKASIQREREIELRRALRTLRTAIDDYHAFVEENKIKVDGDSYGYPEKLQVLVEGVEYKDKDNKAKVRKFLRRLPVNPFDPETDWGLRSYQDKPDATSWGGQNIWDVYCPSSRRALDGTFYRDW